MRLRTHETNWKIIIFFTCLVKLSTCAEDSKNANATIANGGADIASLDAGKCMKNRIGCCTELNLGERDALMKCFSLHQNKIPKEGEKDAAKVIHFFSCFVECQYKSMKYLGKGDSINMEMVKNDAEKIYHDRPKEKEFHIELFEFCRKDGGKTYNKIRKNPASKFLFAQACRPYFLFVFLCQANFHMKIRCPYFMWKGKKKTPAVEECQEAKNKCYAIDGLQPTETRII